MHNFRFLKKKNIFPLEVVGKCFWVRYIFVSIYIRDFCSQCVPGLQTVIILKFTVSKCVSLVYLITVDVGQGQVHPSRWFSTYYRLGGYLCIYTCTYIETDIKELFVQTRIACKLVIGGEKLDERQTYKTDLKILHAVVPWFYMKYAEVLYLIFWYNKSHHFCHGFFFFNTHFMHSWMVLY